MTNVFLKALNWALSQGKDNATIVCIEEEFNPLNYLGCRSSRETLPAGLCLYLTNEEMSYAPIPHVIMTIEDSTETIFYYAADDSLLA